MSARRLQVHVLVAALLTGMGSGCSSVRESFHWKAAVFARVPGTPPGSPGGPTTDVVETNGWWFQHVVAGPKDKTPEAQWWMVWPDREERPREHHLLKRGNATLAKANRAWRMLWWGHNITHADWGRVRKLSPEIASAAFDALGAYPQMIQPDLIFGTPTVARAPEHAGSTGTEENATPTESNGESATPAIVGKLEVGELPSAPWAKGSPEAPPFDPIWHQGEAFTQLADAKRRVREATGGKAGGGIRIGILDTGFNARHTMIPLRIAGGPEGEWAGDAVNVLVCNGSDESSRCVPVLPGRTEGHPHGLKAMSLLAAGRFTVEDADFKSGKRAHPAVSTALETNAVEFGGAPDAEIVPVRVAPWIFSAGTANLAYAIDFASRQRGCDVISISHGGSPSPMWIDAVNAAYDRGTAIFAATGDYINLAPVNLGIFAPSATVYPAACRRVMAVSAVAANGEPYGRADFRHHGSKFFLPSYWFLTRGSFGGDGSSRDPFHTSARWMARTTDASQVRQLGSLRAHPVSTYSPNIAVPQPISKANGFRTNRLDLNWNGTSAATPQAAAAAALWLARNRPEIEQAGCWDRWQKAEAVYQAMAYAAKPRRAAMPSPPESPADREPDLYEGVGTLRASDMLDLSFATVTNIQGANLRFPSKAPHRDFYDGARSSVRMMWFHRTAPDPRDRADARYMEVHRSREDWAAAMTTIFYNQFLVRAWGDGHIPIKRQRRGLPGVFVSDEQELLEQAGRTATKTRQP